MKRFHKKQKLKQEIKQEIKQRNNQFLGKILSLPSWKLARPKTRPLILSDISTDGKIVAISDYEHNHLYLFDKERRCFSDFRIDSPCSIKVFEKYICVHSTFGDGYKKGILKYYSF